ncbi:DUF6153 family protein [Streptomyces sp. TRM49041]|uniref:DUF6153 family protein n=1 Tax=Streptomyces sp. TRM49041 TaxID=2603216 RepID=UPI0011ED9B26|nr:DUF6153 family protein [Streptomyces sp. TRM49041]
MGARVRRRCATRGASWCGRLLLLAALLLGIITMHTWGHPSEHADAQSAAAPAHGSAYSEHLAAHGAPAHDAPEDAPRGGMDAAAACFALIGSAGAGLAGFAALRLLRRVPRTEALRSGLTGPRRPLRPQWPQPPPRRVALAELSVLRI